LRLDGCRLEGGQDARRVVMAGGEKVPRKYWWVGVVAVPVAVAIIAILPGLLRPTKPGGGPSTTISGNNNTVSFDYSTHNTFVTNVNVIAREYEVQTGRPMSDNLRAQVQAAVDAAKQNNHAESIRLFENVAKVAPVPAIYHNLSVAYGKVQNSAASRRAFELSKEKIAEVAAAQAKNQSLSADALKPPPTSGPAVRTESSAVPGMTIDPLASPYVTPAEIHVIEHGTPVGGSYQIRYEPAPGATVAMDPGAYDILYKVSSHGAGFVFASNIVVREGTLTRINPNGLVGGIALEAVSKKGFPPLKKVEFIDRGTGDKRLLAQETDTLGVTVPLAPGAYDAVGTTADGQTKELATNLAVRGGQITKFDPMGKMASIVVYAPKVSGLDMKAVYALKAGTNEIEGKVEAWDVPMLVSAGGTYDIALEQSAGLTRIKKGLTPGNGELVEIR
jgi:hypothetical protein